jgi:hypothetical protein
MLTVFPMAMRLEELTARHLLHFLNQWRRDIGTNGAESVETFLNYGNPSWLHDQTIGNKARLAALVEQVKINIRYNQAWYPLGSPYNPDARLRIYGGADPPELRVICVLPHNGVKMSTTAQAAETFNSQIEEYLLREDKRLQGRLHVQG